MEIKLKDNEVLHDLNLKGYKIIQSSEHFRFGTDAVLLADFANAKKGENAVDLGTGQGIIPILLCVNTNVKKVTGIEIQKELCDMAERSVIYNNLADRIDIINADLKDLSKVLPKGSYDLVICNPPYKPSNAGLKSEKMEIKIAKNEILCTLEDVIKSGGELLRFGGRFCICHRPERLSDITFLMRKYNIEPKVLTCVHPSTGKAPALILIEGKRGVNSGMIITPPLILYDDNGNYTKEVNSIYRRDDEIEK